MTSEPTGPPPPRNETAADTPAIVAPSPPGSSTGPLLAWLIAQFALLLIAAFRIPLAAQYPEPGEQLAAHFMFGGQVVAAGLMFPFLLRGAGSTVQIWAAALPFQLAAGYLAGRAPAELIVAALFVGGWLLTLGLWSACLTSRPLRLLGIAVANCLTLGAGVLRYLRLEFAAQGGTPTAIEMAPPLPTTLAAVEGTPILPGSITLCGLAAAAALILVIRRTARRRRLA